MSDNTKDSKKSVRLPWSDEPFVDAKAAESKAIAAAQPPRVDVNSPRVQAAAQKAFRDEIDKVVNARRPVAGGKGNRQETLFPAAANLYELVAAGALDETEVTAALRDACRVNHLEQDDGALSVERTLRNALRRGFDNPRDLSRYAMGGGDRHEDDEPKLLVFDDFRRLERGFWTERDSLQNIYLAALSRMCSPWAVLAHSAVRVLALVRPHVALPDLIGGPGSLNWFAVIAAKSGDGKSASKNVARQLVPGVYERNLGSGEGLVDAFVRPADKETGEPAGVRESVLFTVDEGDSLRALGTRSGATLPGSLRTAFTGDTLGFAYRGNDRHLDAHTYRLTMVVNVQPAKAGVLLDDKTGGMLQRFQWFPGTDQRIDSRKPSWPGPLTLPSPAAWMYARTVKIPCEARELIEYGAEARNRGEPNPLDGHALFAREKFAYALAVLDGRDAMNPDDWRLAGVAMRVSDHVRAYVTQQVEVAATADAEERGKVRGVEYDAANTERSSREYKRRRRIENWIVGKLESAGKEGVTEGNLRHTAARQDGQFVASTLEKLEKDGEVKQLDPRPGERTIRWALAG